MRFSLVGELVQGGGHDEDKVFSIEEYFDAKDSETAILIAKAMVQSQKLVQEKYKNQVSGLNAVLKDHNGRILWKTNLVLERTQTKVVTPEYFNEEVISTQ